MLLTSHPPGSDVANWNVVISDSFDTNDNHWNTGDINDPGNATGTLQIIDGKYRWNIGADRTFATITSKSQAPDGDFYASVDVHQLDGSAVCGYGLLLRDNSAGVYQFGLADHDKQFSVFAWNESTGTSRQLIDPAGSDAIRPGEVNRLAVIAEGAHYSFFINNQPVGEMTDNEWTSGHVTLFTQLCQLGDSAVIEFDNMELRVPQATRPTSTRNPSLAPTLTSASDVVAELFRRTNDLRQNNKLPLYALNADLNQVALAHSQDMATREQLTDTGADGSTVVQRITNAGYGAGQPAEAICNGPGETVDGAWGKLTANSADLANLLNSVNTDIGIGVAEGKSNTYYTIVFGKPAQAIEVTPQAVPTGAPVLTPQAEATPSSMPIAIQGFSTANSLNGQILLAGYSGPLDPPVFQDRISFEWPSSIPPRARSTAMALQQWLCL